MNANVYTLANAILFSEPLNMFISATTVSSDNSNIPSLDTVTLARGSIATMSLFSVLYWESKAFELLQMKGCLLFHSLLDCGRQSYQVRTSQNLTLKVCSTSFMFNISMTADEMLTKTGSLLAVREFTVKGPIFLI